MKLFKTLGLAVVAGAVSFGTATAADFECTGNSECIFQINDDTPQSCIEAIEIFTGPLTGTGPVQIALVDYKSLAGVCFTLNTNREGVNLITQTQTPGGYQFVYTSDFVEAQVPGIPGTFYSQNELRLEALNLYPNPLGENPGPIAYEVTEDVEFVNGGERLRVFAGSSVVVETKKPKIICDLTSNKCYIQINGSDFDINPTITIESEAPEQSGNILIGRVTAKQLIDDLGLEMTLDFKRDPDESYFALEPLQADQTFPAMVRGYFASQITYEDEIYHADGVLQIESVDPVESWPPADGAAQYIITEPVIFTSDSGNEIIVHEGHISN